MSKDKISLALMLSLFVASLIFAGFALRVTEEDINKCYENSNYSKETCYYQLMR